MKNITCSQCLTEKKEIFFYEKKKGSGKRCSICKDCSKEKAREWYEKNKEKAKETRAEYANKNKEKIRLLNKKWVSNNIEKSRSYKKAWKKKNQESSRESAKRCYARNRESILERKRKRRQEDRAYDREYLNKRRSQNPKLRINDSIGNGIRDVIRGRKNRTKWTEILGYSIDELVAHLSSLFKEGMSMENYGEWHIDHIKPVKLFDFSGDWHDSVKECWALNNLQPLWADENIRKGAKYDG